MSERVRHHEAFDLDSGGTPGDPQVHAQIEQVLADPARRTLLMSTISHELRSPLLTIRMGSQLVEKSLAPDDEYNRELLQHIRVAAQRLEIMAQNLLQMSRMTTGMVQFSPQDQPLAPIIHQAVAAAQPEVAATRIHVDAPPDIQVHADPERLKQILVNLLSNALKYSPADAPVQVQAAVEPRSGRMGCDRVAIEVADRGAGIDPEHREAIFQPFYRIEDDGLTKAGAGLGLFISRELARRMGGDVTVASSAGEGATFTLTLPCGAGEAV